MERVRCVLPHASEEINGVKFARAEDGAMVSEEVSAEVADNFASIPGYEKLPKEPKKDPPVPGDKDGDGKPDRAPRNKPAPKQD